MARDFMGVTDFRWNERRGAVDVGLARSRRGSRQDAAQRTVHWGGRSNCDAQGGEMFTGFPVGASFVWAGAGKGF